MSNGATESEFGGSWASFEACVRRTIGGDFTWKLLWRDTPKHRKLIITSIRAAMKANGGVFPKEDTFLERKD